MDPGEDGKKERVPDGFGLVPPLRDADASGPNRDRFDPALFATFESRRQRLDQAARELPDTTTNEE
jgi:hypothetical protein